MTTIINTKVGENRGRARVWLEGIKLEREGFLPGMRYNLELQDSKIVLRTSETGYFTISRRERNGKISPIIDICSNELRRLFAGVHMLRVAIRRGSIVISAHASHAQVKERVQRLIDKIEHGKPLDVCSLFHGGGVLDKALHAGLASAGVQSNVAMAVELEGKYLDSSLRNNPELWSERSMVFDSPIQAVEVMTDATQVDVLVGGIPCTGASKSGRSKNKLQYAESHSDAGAMFFHFLQFVQVLNPSVVLIENVPEYAHTASMEVIRSVLGSLDYQVQERVLDGTQFGSLEKRKRLCVIAISNGLNADFALESVQGDVRSTHACIRDILDPIGLDSDRWHTFEYLADKEVRDKALGKGFSRQLLSGQEPYCGTIGKDYAKCRSTEPFLVHPEDPALSRIFTACEHARLKGVPESTITGLPESIAHQILGQSVIFPVFEAVGRALGRALMSLLHVSQASAHAALNVEPDNAHSCQLALI